MHRVEEISLLRDQVETLEADRDRWRRYAGMLRDRLAAAQDAVRKWHHHAYCRDYYNGRVGEELRSLAAERDALNRQLDHADGRIIYLTSCVDALRRQLAESEQQLALRIEADNANRGQLAAAKDQVRMVVESWRQLKARYAESPANHAVPLALLLVHVGMLAGDSDSDAYLFLAALNRTMLDRAQCADLQEQLAECQGNLVRARTVCRETNEARENLLAGNRELIAARDAWKQRAEADAAHAAEAANALDALRIQFGDERTAQDEFMRAEGLAQQVERAEAEAGVMRKTLEEIAASTAGDDEPGDRSPRRAGWECYSVPVPPSPPTPGRRRRR